MQDTELMKKTDLKMKAVVLEATIPGRYGGSPPDNGWPVHNTTVTFIVDTETWKCQGQCKGKEPILADEDWWAEQCQRVSDRVRAQIKSTAA
jgi:hypothetical protein